MEKNKYSVDLCHGSILKGLLLFTFPLLCTYALQSLFNTVDMVIVGRFASHQALAAIGCTLNPIQLVLKIFIGLATGANAVAAMYYGASDHIRFHRGTHTSMMIAALGGIVFTVIALFAAKPLLILTNTPADILEDACIYIWIDFLGIPFLMIFNFGCAVLRAAGDSKRPMVFLLVAGLANVFLNLVFVIVFRMAVAGVAIATTVSNALAAGLVVYTMYRSTDICHLSMKQLKIDWSILRNILWIGIPAGLNSSFFNIANMMIQASLNSFGSVAVAGSSATVSVEGFVSMASAAFQQGVMTLVAQNFGAKNYTRTARSCAVGLFTGAVSHPFCSDGGFSSAGSTC